MSKMELKVARIGNSRGVRLPAATLKRYGIGATLVMEERSDGILLRRLGPAVEKLSWEETARAMAETAEDWSAFDALDGEGLDELPWEAATARQPPVGRKRGGARSPRRNRA